jgi:general L-amino acid transport system substrate-binding protein
MRRKQTQILILFVVLSLILVACGPGNGNVQEPQTQVISTDVVAEPTIPVGGVDETQVQETPTTAVEEPAETQPVIPQTAGFGETLSTVMSRGNLICGVNGQLPGFSFLDPQGEYLGFDADFCRVLAAAIFGDPSLVEYRPTNTQERFTVLQTGEVDVLIRNTTWSLVRDTELGLNFTVTTFYDGQGIMVPTDSGISSLGDLDGGTICVQKGTTTELNLADTMSTEGVNYTPAVFDDVNATYGAYAEGRCDAVTSDKSQLSSVAKAVLPDPDAHVIMDMTLSKEPLAPVVRHGDDQWLDIVNWSIFATIAAEEYGVTSENVEDTLNTSENPEILRLLGQEGDLGAQLGLENDFAVNIISMVGNYQEIYERNLGEGTTTFIPRGLNSLYTAGGLLYSPPFR